MMLKYCNSCFLLNVIIYTVNGAPGRSPTWNTMETTTEEFAIVGGEAVDITVAPYQVSLQLYGRFRCGGSIIADNIILTAAHCVHQKNPNDLKIRAGSSFNFTGGVVRNVNRVLVHPDYTLYPRSHADNDVAVMWLDEKLQFADNIKPVQLAARGAELPAGTPLMATGWGKLKMNGGFPQDSLQMVYLPSTSPQSCQKSYPHTLITNTMLCAGPKQGGKGVCSGDSGGPLVSNGVQYGIASWTSSYCGGPNLPGVFAKVSALRDWINQAISGGI